MDLYTDYINREVERVTLKITETLLAEKGKEIVHKHFYQRQIESFYYNSFHNKFLEEYMQTLENEVFFLENPKFFSHFIYNNNLRGLNTAYLNRLTENKVKILALINADQLSELYFQFFKNIEGKYGNSARICEHGSFFSYLVHNFKPHKYCNLDTRIKKLFGLENTSYFISFLIVSKSYVNFSNQNPDFLLNCKKMISDKGIIDECILDRVSDLKILGFIFWSLADYFVNEDNETYR